MRAPFPSLAIALLCSALLAGCAASEEPSQTTAPEPDVEVEATESTGVIRGVVVDAGVRPLANALVTVTGSGTRKMMNTTENGGFGFDGLVPGTYFVSARKLGFEDAQTSTEVVAGQDEPPAVRIQLQAQAGFVKPFAVPVQFRGYIECGVATIVVSAALCAIPNNLCLPDPLFGTVPCVTHTPTLTEDLFSMYHRPDGVPQFIQGELVWASSQAAGNSLHIAVRTSTDERYAEGFYEEDLDDVEGPSPLLFQVDTDTIEAHDIGTTHGLELDVFSGAGVCDPSGDACLAGVTVEQKFEFFVHFFYGFQPAEGYRFTADGEPKPPA